MTYPDTETVSYVYDDNDNVIEITDPNGTVIDDTFDNNNRRTARSVTRATGVLGTTSETFTYDGLGRMLSAADDDYKVEFTYGVLGLSSQVYEEKQSYVGGTAHFKTVKRTWDAVGNKVSELYPSGLDLDYTWNDIDRLSTVTDGTNTIASYTYIGSRRESVTFQNSTSATYSYTGFRSEVERIHHETSDPVTIVDLQYGYDENHDRTYERFGGGAAAGDAFGYDKARRLTTAWMGSTDVTAPSSNAYTKKVVYTMDDDGNRSSVAVTPYGSGATTTNYTGNNLNQYTAVGGVSRSHDDNGNLIDDGTLDYEYDYKNQIVRVKQSSTTIAEYKYDALGRRVEKDDGTDVRRYVYSGDETVSVYDGSNVWVQDFVFGEVIDEVLMLEQADVLDFDSDANTTETTRSFYHSNALGSVMAITDMNEAEVVSYRYDPYGAVTITRNSTTQSSDPLGQPWMFTGRFADEETGLYYYRARCYSPEAGRFLQRDPLGYIDSPVLYQYASSSPLVLVDPQGLSSQKLGRKAGKAHYKGEDQRDPQGRQAHEAAEAKKVADAEAKKSTERKNLDKVISIVKKSEHTPDYAEEALRDIGEENIFVGTDEEESSVGYYISWNWLKRLLGWKPYIVIRPDVCRLEHGGYYLLGTLLHELRHHHQVMNGHPSFDEAGGHGYYPAGGVRESDPVPSDSDPTRNPTPDGRKVESWDTADDRQGEELERKSKAEGLPQPSK